MIDPLRSLHDARVLALAIVNIIPEPVLILDAQFRVEAASQSFYDVFEVTPEETQGRPLFALGDGQWDIAALRDLLETIIPARTAIDNFEVEAEFPGVGARVMLLNARRIVYEDHAAVTILLAFRDITAGRGAERRLAAVLAATQEVLEQKQVLLQEMQHRVANSLQIIASILLLKARAVSSEETRGHLKDAHQRVMSVAAVQQYLHAAETIERIEVRGYLEKLCTGLAASMVGESAPVTIEAVADEGEIASGSAVSLGLIVTELVINALKYAFPGGKEGARIRVTYESSSEDWRLSVADNGIGFDGVSHGGEPGLGTTIIAAFAKQLGAQVEHDSSGEGLTTRVTRARFIARAPRAA